MGSLAFVAAVRAAWTIFQDPDRSDCRLMLLTKNNLAAKQTGLAFRIVDGAVRWESAPVHMMADQLPAAEADSPSRRKEVERAVEFLRGQLASGPMPVVDLFQRGAEAGFSKSTLQRARDKAEVSHKRQGFGKGSQLVWMLTPSLRVQPPDEQAEKLGINGTNGADEGGKRTRGMTPSAGVPGRGQRSRQWPRPPRRQTRPNRLRRRGHLGSR
jgi:hypothetical protein